MIDDLSTYQISDFLLFSRETLFALFEIYNHEIWPVQFAWLTLAATMFPLSMRRDLLGGRIVACILGAAWLWVGLVFHLKYFSPINWAAKYFAALFVIEAFLVFFVGALFGQLRFKTSMTRQRYVGLGLLAIATFVPVNLLWGQKFSQLLMFGWGPDNTALGTIGVLMNTTNRKIRALLLCVPVVWLILSILIHFGFKSA